MSRLGAPISQHCISPKLKQTLKDHHIEEVNISNKCSATIHIRSDEGNNRSKMQQIQHLCGTYLERVSYN
jgi:hypothetical protein